MDVKKKKENLKNVKMKIFIHVTAGLTNRRLFCKHKSCGKCSTIWKKPVLWVNGFSTGAMSRDNVHATEFPRALTHDFPVPHSQVMFKQKVSFKKYIMFLHQTMGKCSQDPVSLKAKCSRKQQCSVTSRKQ